MKGETMKTYSIDIEKLEVESRQDCPVGHVRLLGRSSMPLRDLTAMRLYGEGEVPEFDDPIDLGVYPAKVGTHWSDQQHGRSGWYYLVGPVPESILPESLASDVGCMDVAY